MMFFVHRTNRPYICLVRSRWGTRRLQDHAFSLACPSYTRYGFRNNLICYFVNESVNVRTWTSIFVLWRPILPPNCLYGNREVYLIAWLLSNLEKREDQSRMRDGGEGGAQGAVWSWLKKPLSWDAKHTPTFSFFTHRIPSLNSSTILPPPAYSSPQDQPAPHKRNP